MEEFQSISVIKVNSNNRYCISVVWAKQKFRFYNGLAIGSHAKPNALPVSERKRAFDALLAQFMKAIRLGWSPYNDWSMRLSRPITENILISALELKLKTKYSYHYEKKLRWIVACIQAQIGSKPITPKLIAEFVNDPKWTPAMRENLKRHLLSLEPQLREFGYKGTASKMINKSKVEEALHKPISNLEQVLEEIRAFNENLHLCVLLIYSCLLRPHREIRLLTWGDFNENLETVSLSGSMTKGKRNRVLPIQPTLHSLLMKKRGHQKQPDINIFSNTPQPYAMDYFNGLWRRFKNQSNILEPGVTLYSFRHTAAIQVFVTSGSLHKLQTVLGHSSMLVSLTYLRGLDTPTINQADLPQI